MISLLLEVLLTPYSLKPAKMKAVQASFEEEGKIRLLEGQNNKLQTVLVWPFIEVCKNVTNYEIAIDSLTLKALQ